MMHIYDRRLRRKVEQGMKRAKFLLIYPESFLGYLAKVLANLESVLLKFE